MFDSRGKCESDLRLSLLISYYSKVKNLNQILWKYNLGSLLWSYIHSQLLQAKNWGISRHKIVVLNSLENQACGGYRWCVKQIICVWYCYYCLGLCCSWNSNSVHLLIRESELADCEIPASIIDADYCHCTWRIES